jgi:hypothetical protein
MNTGTALGTPLVSSSTTMSDIGEDGTVAARPGGAELGRSKEGVTLVPLSWLMRSLMSPYPFWDVVVLLAKADSFNAKKTRSSYHCKRQE